MRNHTKPLVVICALLFVGAGYPVVSSFAQSAQTDAENEAAIRETIKVFFDGMAEQDTTKMWSATERGARLVITTFSQDGEPVMRPISMDQFMGFVTSPREEEVEETYWNEEIYIHDNLATAWMDYNLWVGERIDHCGKDSFQLARTKDGWKVIAIADTQRRSGCESQKK